jgi:hypothetical protein
MPSQLDPRRPSGSSPASPTPTRPPPPNSPTPTTNAGKSSPPFERSKPTCGKATASGPKHPPWSAKKCMGCSSPTTRFAPSWSKPPTPSRLIPTEYHSPAPSTSSADESQTRRDFPPTPRALLHERDIQETIARQNRRRSRSYPRVHKAGNRHAFPTKTREHHQQLYKPRLLITQPIAA